MLIKEIILETVCLPEIKDFYINKFGLNVRVESENFISLNVGTSVLTFKQVTSDVKPFYHFAFNIPENQFSEAKKWIKEERGISLIGLNGEDEFDFSSWNARAFYFYDPAGNIIEFIVRHRLKNASAEKFSQKSILSISEIGMPVRDVGGYFDELSKEFGLPEFSGDRKSFSVSGDDNGLIIIVPEKRIWYPECCEAKIFPVTVYIEPDLKNIKKEKQFSELPYKIISE